MKKMLFPVLLLAYSFNSAAQSKVFQWAASYGGSKAENAVSICQTKDSGYIACGNTVSANSQVTGGHGGQDIWVTKIGATGAIKWAKCYGGSSYESAATVLQTADGGYALAGTTSSTDGNVSGKNTTVGSVWFVKLNDTGGIQWEKHYGGSSGEGCNAMISTSDGGFVMAGLSLSNDGDVSGHHGLSGGAGVGMSDVWVLKIDNKGAMQWQKSFGGSSADYAVALRQTSDGGCIVACTTASNDGDVTGAPLTGLYGLATQYFYWVLKLSHTGTLQWHKTYGGDANCIASDIAVTKDGGFVINGTSNATDVTGHHGLAAQSDIWVVKTDSLGRRQWDRSLGSDQDDFGNAVVTAQDSGFMVLGSVETGFGPGGDITATHGGGLDFWLAKLSPSGVLTWEETFGGSSDDGAAALCRTYDGGYILAGNSQSVDGQVTGNHGNEDYWVVKVNALANVRTANLLHQEGISIFPNPATNNIYINGATNCSVSLLNAMGQLVKREASSSISVVGLPSDLYLLQVFDQSGSLIKQEKIIKK